ncbi:MAG: sigma-E factor regulatory (negative regulator) transcription regulator protein [Pseudomonadota bacterium]|jgi:sigma-E factor negative regulatory protein RseB
MTGMSRLARTSFAALLALAALAPWETARATGTTEADGLRMLARAHAAAQSLSYSGTFVHQRGLDVRSLRIAHQRSANGTLEKLESLDGPPSETVRRGERRLTYLPQQRRILIGDRESGPSFPGLHALDAQRLTAHYRLRWLGAEQVAGRMSSAWALEPRDTLRYGYRFWADTASGLLLRAQTISEKAEVVEQAAFSQLSLGPLPATRLNASTRDTRGWRTVDLSGRPADAMTVAAWRLGWLPPGFQPAGTWVRKLAPASHRDDGERQLLQFLYSDGLAGLSIFIEPWSAERSARPAQQGALNMVGKRHGKFWLTIVGEVPMLAIRQIADAIEFKEAARR